MSCVPPPLHSTHLLPLSPHPHTVGTGWGGEGQRRWNEVHLHYLLPPSHSPFSSPISPLISPSSSPLPLAQASLFSQSWASQGRVVVERLKGRAFFPTQLEGINWRLNLSMAQPSQAKMKLPNAQIEFGIKTGEVTVSAWP